VLQCGVDGLAEDPNGVFNWCIDIKEEGSLGWCVGRVLGWEAKKVLLGGGTSFYDRNEFVN
jgi:histone deacetylase 8